MPTNYEPSDGDYIEADYAKFFNDIQTQASFDFGEYPEICTSLEHGEIYVCGANDESSEWIWQQSFPIPQGWDIEQVKKMFEDYVYLQPSPRLTKRAADKCPVCNGQGSFRVGVYSETCDSCNGTGTCR